MKKILVPTDFTLIADKALDFAVQIAKQAKAEIYLIHTSELLNPPLKDGADFESTLKKYNEENAIDIIAMITYPKSFWDRLLKKSATKEVAFSSKVPDIAITGR